MSSMNGRYDAVVLGADVNGLVCAAWLARRGRKVLLLEQRERVGGLACSVLNDTTGIPRAVVDVLGLQLQFESNWPRVYAPEERGPGLFLSHDAETGARELESYARALGANGSQDERAREQALRDAERYPEFRGFIDRVRGVIQEMMTSPAPNFLAPQGSDWLVLAKQGLALRRLGRKDMIELIRVAPACAADWMNDWFQNPRLKAALVSPGLLGGYGGPWSPGTATNALMWECLAEKPVTGGAPALVQALEQSARAAGVEIRTGVEPRRIRVEMGAVTGVEFAATSAPASPAEFVPASAVVATYDPKRVFLGLVAPGALTHAFEQKIAHWRTRGTTAAMTLKLSRSLAYAGRGSEAIFEARTGETLDQIERAFDPVKYRAIPESPVLDIRADTSGTVSILAHFVPYHLDGGWTDAAREKLNDRILAALDRVAPGARASVQTCTTFTPVDLESQFGLTGGQIHQGEPGLDQLVVRPTPECTRYETPVLGLFLGGNSVFPGGVGSGLSGMPGALAAMALLKRSSNR